MTLRDSHISDGNALQQGIRGWLLSYKFLQAANSLVPITKHDDDQCAIPMLKHHKCGYPTYT